MARFSFRFERVLAVKSIREDHLQSVVGRDERMLADARKQLASLRDRLLEEQAHMRSRIGDAIFVDKALQRLGYIENLHKEILKSEALVKERERALALSKDALMAAVKERKALERLREREYRAYLVESDRREQKEIDEMAQVVGARSEGEGK